MFANSCLAYFILLSLPILLSGIAHADSTVNAAIPPQGTVTIPLNTGGVKGATARESWLMFYGDPMVRNVQQATLTPVLPSADKTTGTAVVVAPGGAFMMLSMEEEGWSIARWLVDHGIAAFVLKYRLRPTAAAEEAFQQRLDALLTGVVEAPRDEKIPGIDAPAAAIADGLAAIRIVRTRAKEWGVDPNRIGMMGFSAGAILTISVAVNADADDMPNFIAPVYGPLTAVTVPDNAPPMFVVMANDDQYFSKRSFGLIEGWTAANKPVEFHLYQRGEHGFGLGREGTTTVGWMNSFYHWLKMNGMLAQ